MIDDTMIIACRRPLDRAHLRRAHDAARRTRDALEMVGSRFVQANERAPHNGWTWRPTPRVVVQSELVRAGNVRILGVRHRSRRSEVVLPEPDGPSTNPVWYPDRGGRHHVSWALRHAESACIILGRAVCGDAVPTSMAKAMLASSCLTAGMRIRDRDPSEQIVSAASPWTTFVRRCRRIGADQWTHQHDGHAWEAVRSAVTIEIHDDTAFLGTLSSGAFPGDPDPIETLRIHARAQGDDS